MALRWRILIVLFAARTTMAFQFQSVGALSPLFGDAYGASLADIGVLIGLYLAPGILLAYPGGALGARIGDRRAVLIGMGLMTAGGALMALGDTWGAQIAGRAVAGVGGILLNVLMTKMVADWFAGREIGTAMGIFLNSWPIGIALALVVLPLVAGEAALAGALAATTAIAACGLALFAFGYREPATDGARRPAQRRPDGGVLRLIVLSGLIWGLYNAALALVFGFGPAVLVARGWSLADGAAATSLILWVATLSIPLGGVVADRTGRRDAVLAVSSILFAAALCLAVAVRGAEATLIAFIVLGFACGLPAGPIMSLPAA